MGWQTVLGCLCVLAATAGIQAVPTPDTMVVSRTDSTTVDTASEDITTEEPARPVKLTEMEVTSNISLRYAHTSVVAHVRNPAKRSQETTFRVLLPETAFISGFTMTLDGKTYKAYVKKKEEAKQIYDQAVSQGIAAAHISTKARDSNHFTVSINVEPNTAAVFNLTYEELLVRRNGVYNHAINLHPGTLVPKLTVTVNIKESEMITVLRVPEVRTGNEIDATAEDPQNTQAVITRGHDDREATIVFQPDIGEQRKLIAAYMDKAKKKHSYDDDALQTPGNLVLGQFVVQYDVARPKEGEILISDGYFVHFFAPSDLPPLNKHVVFVLDTSGSMMDRKIVQLREAMQTILSDLNPGDYFNIVEFDSTVVVHELKEADEEPKVPDYSSFYWSESRKPAKLVAPSPANAENIAKAKVIVSRLHASGGTNIDEALNVAVRIIKRSKNPAELGDSSTTSTAEPMALPLSDPGTTIADSDHLTAQTTTERVTTTKYEAEAIEKAAKLEPIIIFLTDGDPTVGETNPKTIINHLVEKNYGDNKATIFSLAFGEDADRKFLRKISLRNDGFMRHIYEASDAALQLRDFYRQVSSPLLADVKFVYPPDQVKADSLTKHRFRTYYAGSETVVAGRVHDTATEITPQLLAFCMADDDAGSGKKRYEVMPKAPVERKKDFYFPLERLWAYLTVKQLLDERDALLEGETKADDDNSPEKKALDISLKYELVTPLTSLVVVKPNATDAVNAESVDKVDHGYPSAVPAGVPLSSNYLISSDAISGQATYDVEEDALLEQDFSGAVPQKGHFGQRYQLKPSSAQIISAPRLALASVGYRYKSKARIASHRQPASSTFGHRYSFKPASFTSALHRPSAIVGHRFAFRPASSLSIPHRQLASGYPSSGYFAAPGLPGPPGMPGPAYSFPSYAPSTVFDLSISTPAPPPPSALQMYHIEEYKWAEPLLDTGLEALVLHYNTTTRYLKLTTSTTAPQEQSQDADCDNGQDGAKGLCVYLSRCESARNITQEIYLQTYCIVDSRYAGVCCPKTSIGHPRTS